MFHEPYFTVGLGTMPSGGALEGVPVIDGTTSVVPTTAEGSSSSAVALPGASSAALLTNLLPQANTGLEAAPGGIYVGDGLAPVPQKLAERIRRWEFIDMGELLPEFGLATREDDPLGRKSAATRRARKVTDIFTWLHCYGRYVSVLGPKHPEAIAELMAYMDTIVRVCQDFSGLAWVRYDAGFRRQAALTGNRQWSRINSTLYTVCFTGNAQRTTRCELCLGTTHASGECALRGDPDPEMQSRVKAVESVVLALTARPKPVVKNEGGLFFPSGQACRLWNRNSCRFPQCRHAHVCSSCGGAHPATSCPAYPLRVAQPSGQGPATIPTRRPREWSKPY